MSLVKKIDETRNYLIKEIKHKNSLSEKYKKKCKYLNYVENLPILALTITSFVSMSTFASFASIKKKKKKHDKILLLGKDTLNTIKVLISKTLIDSYISHDEFVSVNNVLKEHNVMEEEIKKS